MGLRLSQYEMKFEKPPLFDLIAATFPVVHGVLFAHAPAIYNPDRVGLAPELAAHEAVHIERQGGDPEGWWKKYCADPIFRLNEEIPAHQAEFRVAVARRGDNRKVRRKFAAIVGNRLVAPLYRYPAGFPGKELAREIVALAQTIDVFELLKERGIMSISNAPVPAGEGKQT